MSSTKYVGVFVEFIGTVVPTLKNFIWVKLKIMGHYSKACWQGFLV